MNKEILPANGSEKRENFLISARSIIQKFLTFFRGFTEEDARALLSAYGLYSFEVDCLRENRPNEQKGMSGNCDDSRHRSYIACSPGPISIGVHPDIFRTNGRTARETRRINTPSDGGSSSLSPCKIVNRSQLRRR